MRGHTVEDPISGITYRRLLPYGRVHSRANVLAPDSLSLERHRTCWLFLKNKTDFFNARLRFLHLAPEYCFLKIFKSLSNLDYVTADLNSPWADIHLDVHNIPFEDGSFDALMANHLMEHVEDDHQVLCEFYRILRPGGWALFMIPLDISSTTTLEDTTIVTPADREKYYWQKDHLRLYGLDFIQRLEKVGFIVSAEKYAEGLGAERIARYALNPDEYIFFCRK